MNKPVVGIALVMSLLLTACGVLGGDDKAETTTDSTTPPGPSVTALSKVNYQFPPTLSTNQADLGKNLKIALTAKDLPTGWVPTFPPSSFTPRPEIMDEVLVQCFFGDRPAPLTSYVTSPLYVSKDFRMFAQSFTRTVSTKAAAAQDFKNFTADRISKCQDSMYDREQNPPTGVNPTDVFGKKFAAATPVTMPVDPAPSLDGTKDILGFKMIVSPTDRPATHQDVFAYGAGRYETVLIVQGPAALDTATEASIMKNLKSRTLAAALQG